LYRYTEEVAGGANAEAAFSKAWGLHKLNAVEPYSKPSILSYSPDNSQREQS
jgi:hypothetical protein